MSIVVALETVDDATDQFAGVVTSTSFTNNCVVLKESGPELFTTMLVWPEGSEPVQGDRPAVRLSDGSEVGARDPVVVTGRRVAWPSASVEFQRCGAREGMDTVVIASSVALA